MKTKNETVKEVKNRVLRFEEEHRAGSRVGKFGRAAALALCALLVLGACWGIAGYEKRGEIAYRILLDVNPSLEIAAAEDGSVYSVEALNPDAEEILKEKDYVGKSVEETVDALIGDLVEKGYLSPESNSVLVSVEGEKDSASMEQSLSETITNAMADRELEGSVMVQQVSQATELEAIAAQYGISLGKAQLISRLIEQNKLQSVETLAAMSIHELNLLRLSWYVDVNATQGSASLMAYISSDRAKEIAAAHAGVPVSGTPSLDCDRGAMLYVLEWDEGDFSYRYRINAVTGEILSDEKTGKGNGFVQKEQDPGFIGMENAQALALAHAGMKDENLIAAKLYGDWVDGKAIYKLTLRDGRTIARYTVDARSGDILQYGTGSEPRDFSAKETLIGDMAAKRIAYARDGLLDGYVNRYEMNLVKAESGYVYEMRFYCDSVRYECKISASDGAVVEYLRTPLTENGTPSQEEGQQGVAKEEK